MKLFLFKSEILILINFIMCTCKSFLFHNPQNKFWGSNLNKRTGTVSKSILEDAFLTTTELISKYKYNAETHYVTTEDGYILSVHRIARPGRQPVFLQHGLVDSSATFVIMGPDSSLGYYLSDNGFDVWLGNSRGNRYSKNHTTLNPQDPNFWEFSWHEMGLYDLPATIDYILNVTEFDRLHYIGHSQGVTIFFVMCSKRPEYNEKIILMQGLAPPVYNSHSKTLVMPFAKFFIDHIPSKSAGELFPYGFLRRTPCFRGNRFELICLEGFFSVVGRDAEQFNNTMAPIIFSHAPAGCSLRQMRHFLQILNSGKFSEYDFDEIENLKKYGMRSPPDYNITTVTASIVLHYGSNDYLVDPLDVEKLYKVLKNIRGVYRAPIAKFNHVDFLWSINVKNVNKKLLLIIEKFEAGILEYTIE